jgi:hypothetical protein
MREHEHEREPEARLRTRKVSRSVVDDISTWWHGEPNFKVEKVTPEKPVTKQDFDQMMSMVFFPVQLSHQDVYGKAPDAATCKTAGSRLAPAASALQVIANGKRDPKNQQAILTPLPDIQLAQTTLQVMGDDGKAPEIWRDAFQTAMQVVDAVSALQVYDPDAQAPDNADPPPADSVTKRDHDLLEASVKPTLQRLVTKTAGVAGLDWDATSYTEGSETLSALSSISHPKLKPAYDAVQRGVQAITAYIKTNEANAVLVSGSLETAMQKISQAQTPYMDEVEKEMAAQEPPK